MSLTVSRISYVASWKKLVQLPGPYSRDGITCGRIMLGSRNIFPTVSIASFRDASAVVAGAGRYLIWQVMEGLRPLTPSNEAVENVVL